MHLRREFLATSHEKTHAVFSAFYLRPELCTGTGEIQPSETLLRQHCARLLAQNEETWTSWIKRPSPAPHSGSLIISSAEFRGGSPQQEHCRLAAESWQGGRLHSRSWNHPHHPRFRILRGWLGWGRRKRQPRSGLSDSCLGSWDACRVTFTRAGQPTPFWVTCCQPQVTRSVRGLLPNIRSQSIIHPGRAGQGEEETQLETEDQARPRQNRRVQKACFQRLLLFPYISPFSEIIFSLGLEAPKRCWVETASHPQ